MARNKAFLGAEFSGRFKESYAALSPDRWKGADKVVLALMKQEVTPGMRVKPIAREKCYYEARINDGDRQIYRTEVGKLWVVDVVAHDDIGRYTHRRTTVENPF